MAKGCKKSGYVFGGYRLDCDKRMLYRGDAEIALPPKVIETLTVLVENHGEIVTKAELMERVWADSIVEESNLSQHLYLLRKTLGDAADGRPVIETLRRRGYRFNAEAAVIDAEAQSDPESRTAPSTPLAHRQQNVLASKDWKQNLDIVPPPAIDDQPVPVAAAEMPNRRNRLWATAFGAGAAAVLVLAFIWWFWPNRNYVGASDRSIESSFLTNGGLGAGVTISPNGNYFVYHEMEAPVARLWLQQTGQPVGVEIIPAAERTIGAKTFSPDGQYIYFVAREKSDETSYLYRVPTLGGLHTRVLANVETPVTFSPDGREMAFIRFDRESRVGQLVVASSEGKNERVVLRRDADRAMGSGTAWSPDGRLIAFSSVAGVDEDNVPTCSFEAVELSSGGVIALSPERWDTCYRMQWTNDGKGLVLIGTAYGEANSPKRDQLYYLTYPGGVARRLTNEGNRHDPLSLGLTRNDEAIVLAMGRSSQIWAMDASGETRTAKQLTRGLFDGRGGIAPLPDGRVGYVSRTGETVHVWIMNADGTEQRQLTSEPSNTEELRSSPDGRFFVFSALNDRRSHLFRINPDGSGQAQITAGRSSDVDSTISPDGEWVVYTPSVFEEGRWKHSIWKVPSAGGSPVQLSQQECAVPHFSPDGQHISCVADYDVIHILRAEDGAVVAKMKPRPLAKLHFGARWSPDGGSVVYISYDDGTANLWSHPVNGGEPARLTDFAGGDIYHFAFSIDGQRIFLARGHPVHDALLIRNFR